MDTRNSIMTRKLCLAVWVALSLAVVGGRPSPTEEVLPPPLHSAVPLPSHTDQQHTLDSQELPLQTQDSAGMIDSSYQLHLHSDQVHPHSDQIHVHSDQVHPHSDQEYVPSAAAGESDTPAPASVSRHAPVHEEDRDFTLDFERDSRDLSGLPGSSFLQLSANSALSRGSDSEPSHAAQERWMDSPATFLTSQSVWIDFARSLDMLKDAGFGAGRLMDGVEEEGLSAGRLMGEGASAGRLTGEGFSAGRLTGEGLNAGPLTGDSEVQRGKRLAPTLRWPQVLLGRTLYPTQQQIPPAYPRGYRFQERDFHSLATQDGDSDLLVMHKKYNQGRVLQEFRDMINSNGRGSFNNRWG